VLAETFRDRKVQQATRAGPLGRHITAKTRAE
jgi:hypothetical protein